MRHLALLIGVASAFAPHHAAVARQACVVQGEECTHEGTEAYAAIQFESTKPSLRTFLKLWLMGGLTWDVDEDYLRLTGSVLVYDIASNTTCWAV